VCIGTGARSRAERAAHGRRPSEADPGHAGEARRVTIPNKREPSDVAIVGGGLIGLAVAWRARARGLRVCVLERGELGRGTSNVAAGMLAPISEADAGERALLRLGLESARRWPAFAAELEESSGLRVDYRAEGTLLVARDRDEAEWLERELALRERFELRAERLLPSQARRLEPALAPTLRLGLDVPDDHAVDPRLTVAALARAAERAGAALRPGAEVAGIRPGEGVALAGGEVVAAEQIVVAAGPWSGTLPGLPEDARVPVRPVKGQSLRLRDPAGPGLVERVVRWDGGYLVPRGDGRYVLGATVEERGFDTSITAGAVHDLLRDGSELVPGVLELDVEELIAGLRPGTPDNVPIIGRAPAAPGLVWATGHYRNGALLAPVTADLVVAALCDEQDVDPAYGPQRFAEVAA
jgi:glycine oxidase